MRSVSKFYVLVFVLVWLLLPKTAREELRGLCASMNKSDKDKKGVVVSFRVTQWQYLRLLELQDTFRFATVADLMSTISMYMVGVDEEDTKRLDILAREVAKVMSNKLK